MRRLLDVTARLFDRAGDAHLEIRVLGVGSGWPGPPRTQRGDGELLFLEERDERTSARCTSGAVRELALLDGVHLRGAAGSSGVELVLRVHNAVSGCRRWTAGFSFSATNTEVARAPA